MNWKCKTKSVLKAQGFADSDVIYAHRGQRWSPWFNTLFKFDKTHSERIQAICFSATHCQPDKGWMKWGNEGMNGWTDKWLKGCMKKINSSMYKRKKMIWGKAEREIWVIESQSIKHTVSACRSVVNRDMRVQALESTLSLVIHPKFKRDSTFEYEILQMKGLGGF